MATEIKFDYDKYIPLMQWAESNNYLCPMIFKSRNSDDWGIEIMKDDSNLPMVLTIGETIDIALERAAVKIAEIDNLRAIAKKKMAELKENER